MAHSQFQRHLGSFWPPQRLQMPIPAAIGFVVPKSERDPPMPQIAEEDSEESMVEVDELEIYDLICARHSASEPVSPCGFCDQTINMGQIWNAVFKGKWS